MGKEYSDHTERPIYSLDDGNFFQEINKVLSDYDLTSLTP